MLKEWVKRFCRLFVGSIFKWVRPPGGASAPDLDRARSRFRGAVAGVARDRRDRRRSRLSGSERRSGRGGRSAPPARTLLGRRSRTQSEAQDEASRESEGLLLAVPPKRGDLDEGPALTAAGLDAKDAGQGQRIGRIGVWSREIDLRREADHVLRANGRDPPHARSPSVTFGRPEWKKDRGVRGPHPSGYRGGFGRRLVAAGRLRWARVHVVLVALQNPPAVRPGRRGDGGSRLWIEA
jgi:hypothetical protein